MKKTLLTLAVSISSFVSYAEIKIKSVSELQTTTDDTGNSLITIVLNLIAAALAVGLLYVIYAIASNHPKAREYGISWFIALVIYLVARFTIFQ